MRKNTVVLDIDGILADYRLGLLYWIRQSMPHLALKANILLDQPAVWINQESMGITYREWLGVLEMFRMSGGKQTIPLFPGAKELVDLCRKMGCEVVLLTSRPIDIYSNIYRDTVEWLRNNSIEYDILLWSKSKADMVYKMRLVDKIYFAVDDEIQHILDYHKLGIPTYWVDHYNRSTTKDTNMGGEMSDVTVVKNLKGIIEHLTKEAKHEQPQSHVT